jgi:hypothetical protein
LGCLSFEVSFLLAPSPSNVPFRFPDLTLPISRFSQPSYGCYILCARFGLWVCSAPLAPVGFLSFRALPVCRAPRHLWRWFASSQLPFPYGFLLGFDEVPCL